MPPLSSLTTRAYHTHTRAHFTPQHWLCAIWDCISSSSSSILIYTFTIGVAGRWPVFTSTPKQISYSTHIGVWRALAAGFDLALRGCEGLSCVWYWQCNEQERGRSLYLQRGNWHCPPDNHNQPPRATVAAAPNTSTSSIPTWGLRTADARPVATPPPSGASLSC